MQKQDGNNTAPIEETVSLTAVLSTLWRARWTILIGTLLVGAVGLGWCVLRAKYQSQAFFQFGGPIPVDVQRVTEVPVKRDDRWQDRLDGPRRMLDADEAELDLGLLRGRGIALDDFKRYSAAFSSSERFADYVRELKLETAPGVSELRRVFTSRNGISRVIEPAYAFTKSDAKDLVDLPKEMANNVIGLRIDYEAGEPRIAQEMTGLLGRYAMDSIIYMVYQDQLRFRPDDIRSRVKRLDVQVLRYKRAIDELRQRSSDIKEVMARNPKLIEQAERQTVIIASDSARYTLPPGALLVGAEVQIVDLNRAIAKATRDRQKCALLLEYYDQARLLLNETKSGEAVLRKLEAVRTKVFKDKDMNDPVVAEVNNALALENETALDQYLSKSRFIVSPSLPTQSNTHVAPVVVASLLLGLLFSILLVAGREWWRRRHLVPAR